MSSVFQTSAAKHIKIDKLSSTSFDLETGDDMKWGSWYGESKVEEVQGFNSLKRLYKDEIC